MQFRWIISFPYYYEFLVAFAGLEGLVILVRVLGEARMQSKSGVFLGVLSIICCSFGQFYIWLEAFVTFASFSSFGIYYKFSEALGALPSNCSPYVCCWKKFGRINFAHSRGWVERKVWRFSAVSSRYSFSSMCTGSFAIAEIEIQAVHHQYWNFDISKLKYCSFGFFLMVSLFLVKQIALLRQNFVL